MTARGNRPVSHLTEWPVRSDRRPPRLHPPRGAPPIGLRARPPRQPLVPSSRPPSCPPQAPNRRPR